MVLGVLSTQAQIGIGAVMDPKGASEYELDSQAQISAPCAAKSSPTPLNSPPMNTAPSRTIASNTCRRSPLPRFLLRKPFNELSHSQTVAESQGSRRRPVDFGAHALGAHEKRDHPSRAC